jgi:hypothetical protein
MIRIHKFAAVFALTLLTTGSAWAQCDPNDANCMAREREEAQAQLDQQQAQSDQQQQQAPPPEEQQQQGGGGAQRAQRPKKGGGG